MMITARHPPSTGRDAQSDPIRAISYHADLRRRCGRLEVTSIFAHSLHLRTLTGWIVTVGAIVHDGPLGIRVDSRAMQRLMIGPGTPARLDAAGLSIGKQRIELKGAEIWNGVPSSALTPEYLSDWMSSALVSNLIPDRTLATNVDRWGQDIVAGIGLPTEIRARGESLLRALDQSDPEPVRHAVHALLGLGPGLTPAGDDLLCGLMAGLHVLGCRLSFARGGLEAASHSIRQVTRLQNVVDDLARRRTTNLSRTLLWYAGQGVAVEPVLRVLCTLGTQTVPDGLAELLAIGHSSGRDLWNGVQLAIRVILRGRELRGATLASPT